MITPPFVLLWTPFFYFAMSKTSNFMDMAILCLQKYFWRERAAFGRSAFGRSTAGNDVVATIFIRIFFFLFFPFFFPFFFLRRDLFS